MPAADDDGIRASRTRKPVAGASRQQMAEILACSLREVHYLAEQGLLVRSEVRGRYLLLPSVQNVIKHLRERAAGRESKDGKIDVVTANAALRESQKRLVDLRIAEKEGKLLDIDEVERVWGEYTVQLRQLVLSIPGQVASRIPGLTPTDHKIVNEIVLDTLAEAVIGTHDKAPLHGIRSPEDDSRSRN